MAILVILTLQKPAAALPMCLRAARALSWIRCAARTGPSRGRKARSITTLSYQHEAAPAPQLGLWAGFPGLRRARKVRQRCGIVSLLLVKSFAMDRTKASVNPPAAVPQITGADTQSKLSMTLDARFHSCPRWQFPDEGLVERRDVMVRDARVKPS